MTVTTVKKKKEKTLKIQKSKHSFAIWPSNGIPKYLSPQNKNVLTKTCAQMSRKNSGRNPYVLQWVKQTVLHPQHGHCSATNTRGRVPRHRAEWKEPISEDCAGEDCIYITLSKCQRCADGEQMSRCQRTVRRWEGGAVCCKRGRSLWRRCCVQIVTARNSSAQTIKAHGTNTQMRESWMRWINWVYRQVPIVILFPS